MMTKYYYTENPAKTVKRIAIFDPKSFDYNFAFTLSVDCYQKLMSLYI